MFKFVKDDVLRYYKLTGRNKSKVSILGIISAFFWNENDSSYFIPDEPFLL